MLIQLWLVFFKKQRLLLLVFLALSLTACDSDENPPPTKKIPPPATQVVQPAYYQVKQNDTLYAIGIATQHSYQELARWNALEPPYLLKVGQHIQLSNPLKPDLTGFKNRPGLSETKIATPPVLSLVKKSSLPEITLPTPGYIVQPHDTLYSISRRFGVSVTLLSAENNIATPEQLRVGQKIKISLINQKDSDKSSSKIYDDNTKKQVIFSAKTSIISINNETMLKFYYHLPVAGKILKNFSETGNRGIEIAGKFGQKIRAAADGKVVAVKAAIYGYGVFIVLEHPDGYLTSYAYNHRALVKVGQRVKQGQVIAEMGRIGHNLPSLEFAMRKNGQPVNPLRFSR